jgi:carbonic anhydrase/acetyltransferase-like protein (isoleucine patch superfamily)
MVMDRLKAIRCRRFRPAAEPFEGRFLLSATAGLRQDGFFHPIRPNTPVLPYGAPANVATFVDTTAHIFSADSVFVGFRTFIGPYSTLAGNRGFIKIGVNAAILDNAQILANPQHVAGAPGIVIGNTSVIDIGATVQGPATVGSLLPGAAPTFVGANALIDGATIEPGAWVSPLARVGPGVTVPTGLQVLPGQNVTTEAEATNPSLGKVAKITSSQQAALKKLLSWSAQLATGYANLYQGNSATGPSIGTTTKGVFNGDLAAVEGSSQEPGPANGAAFEPATIAPTFPTPRGLLVPGQFPNFRARATGGVNFHSRVALVAHHLGRGNAIRGDGGQPINFAGSPVTSNNVSINAPFGNAVTIGSGLQAGAHAVLVADASSNLTIGNNVTIGPGAVVSGSKVGNHVTIGTRAFVSDSTLADGAVVPDGTIVIQNKVVGSVQW